MAVNVDQQWAGNAEHGAEYQGDRFNIFHGPGLLPIGVGEASVHLVLSTNFQYHEAFQQRVWLGYMYKIENDAAMRALGKAMAEASPANVVIYLSGELGAGKSTLCRGFILALGHTGSVRSPTYTLVEPYELGERQVYHLDLYRLADPEELEYLGLRDWLEQDAIILVEWPQMGEGVLMPADLQVQIDYDGAARQVNLQASSVIGEKMITRLSQIMPLRSD